MSENRLIPPPPHAEATIFQRLILSKVTARTRDAYAADLWDFGRFLGIKATIGHHPLATVPDKGWRQLDTAHVAAYLEHLQQTVNPKTQQSYSTATIARRITAVRELLTRPPIWNSIPGSG